MASSQAQRLKPHAIDVRVNVEGDRTLGAKGHFAHLMPAHAIFVLSGYRFQGRGVDDFLDGGAGADRLDGMEGNDELWGGSGADTLVGLGGDDAGPELDRRAPD